MLLVYTSLLYSTLVLHAFHAQQTMYHHVFLTVTICSILRYTTNNALVYKLDTWSAHIAFLAVCLHTQETWLAIFPACVALLWIAEHVWPQKATQMHALLHVVSVVGVHAYIMYNDKKNE